LAHIHPDQSTFEWWPQYIDSSNDVLSNALDDVVEIVDKESLPLWSTHVGHVTASDGLLNVGEKSIALREALQEAKIPVVYVPDRLHRRIEHIFKGQILYPQRLSLFLINKNDQIRDWSLSTKNAILEYLLSQRGINELGFLELFPFRDGKYRSIADHAAFICRNEAEIDLFNLQDNHNIDFNKLSVGTLSVLNDWCKASTGHKSIRYRSANDFRDYCLEFVFLKTPREEDMVSFDTKTATFVSRAWDWIIDQRIDILGVISDLWFIPLTNGHHRKIKPRHSTSETIFAPLGPVGDFMRAFDVKYSSRIKPLLHTIGLSNQVRDHLITTSRSDANLLIKHGGNMIDFAQWLYHIRNVVDLASDEEKVKLVEVIAANLQIPLPQSEQNLIADAIGALEIFKKVSWKAKGDKR
jgi:sacsin